MDLGLKGLRAVVTGGTKGIGRAAAEIFAGEGASVAICARNADEVKAAVKDARAKGVQAYGAGVDVADKAALQTFDRRQRAGARRHRHPGRQRLRPRRRQMPRNPGAKSFDVDMMHTVNAVDRRPALSREIEAPLDRHRVVRLGSRGRFRGRPYGAMKAALIHYAQRLAFQHAAKMIRVNAVSPGNTYFEGGVWHNIEKNLPDLFKARST